jgi:lipoprotein-anchoring transpeptidase ErfK/SrfK
MPGALRFGHPPHPTLGTHGPGDPEGGDGEWFPRRDPPGGDAIIGIHGTNKPKLVGQDVSAGCIRIKNEDIRTLARRLPLGTPVQIRA